MIFNKKNIIFARCKEMVDVAQLVRAPDCGSGGRRFEPDLPPQKGLKIIRPYFFLLMASQRYYTKETPAQ